MNKIQELTDKITKGASQKSKNKEVTDIIKDTRLPLEDRWNLYILAVNSNYLINTDTDYLDLEELGIDIEDVGYTGENRHEDYYACSILDCIENLEIKPDINRLKEIILQDGHSSWIYDW